MVAQDVSIDDVEGALFASVTSSKQHESLEDGTNKLCTIQLKSLVIGNNSCCDISVVSV
jgi:hypothetical protein